MLIEAKERIFIMISHVGIKDAQQGNNKRPEDTPGEN